MQSVLLLQVRMLFHHRQTNIEFSSYPTAKCKKCTILSSGRGGWRLTTWQADSN